MTDEKLIEAMARAICLECAGPNGLWHLYVVEATAALAAYRQCTGDDGK